MKKIYRPALKARIRAASASGIEPPKILKYAATFAAMHDQFLMARRIWQRTGYPEERDYALKLSEGLRVLYADMMLYAFSLVRDAEFIDVPPEFVGGSEYIQ